MFYRLSVVSGVAVSSYLTVKFLNHFERREQVLNAGDVGLEYENTELKLVQVLFRHGARTPLKLIPGLEETVWNKYELRYDLEHTKLRHKLKNLKRGELPPLSVKDELRGGCRMGQMTITGQQQTFELGRKLKELYIDDLNFIGQTFDPNSIYLRTTYVERTIESLRCLVAGMFAGHIQEPVTFWTMPLDDEFLFPNWETCKALRQYIKYCFKTGYRLPGYKDDLEKFSKMIGRPLPKKTFIDIYDDLNCRRAHNKAYPENIKSFMSIIEKHALQHLSESFLSPPPWTNDKVLPMSCGRLVQTLFRNMKSKIDRKNQYKLYLYSVHDTSLITLFSALDMKFDKWPPFGAYISLELYEKKDGQHYVGMRYCGNPVTFKRFNKKLLKLSQFEEIVTPFFLDGSDLENACETIFNIPDN
ncbi:lysophosphatidic acid phosphatase type 6-like [Dendronephthya gigantea]|uniref:lysophosphatidic acid phosphatase type 6-like n=1 Tax=Dendronephthya gigantea TaxID=151771 RepID=UPI00106AD74E|nr:lysophosphatidic acid phosphatase type 6-like [Dendronephthya gigantea]